VARIVALPDKVEQVKSALMQLLSPTRLEDGCIIYQLLQNQEDPTDFTFVEEWESNAKLDAHLASAHLQEALPKLNGALAASPDIRRYRLLA
jgi:quinol monooxygenase YgiN